jgi:glycosyltransferase involved in cell wall biosynthesis
VKIQFILKKNETYSFTTYCRRSSGLWNSTRFIVESLRSRGIEADIVEVQDNNCIDREVTRFRPDVVIIEALWVVPEKFDVLKRLHPSVQWFVHMHSGIPFLALEGIAMEWLKEYVKKGLGVIANSKETFDAFMTILPADAVTYLPNVYLSEPRQASFFERDTIEIGCFGAIRPLKNQLIQAVAAIRFAREKRKKLKFWVNGSRTETGGDPVLKNLKALFDKTPDARLCQSKWNEPEEFLSLLQSMDLGLQVSLTETFNVVCADYVTAGIPVVASDDVKWLSSWCKAKDDSIDSIINKMHLVWRHRWLVWWNQWLLKRNSRIAQDSWFEFCCSAVDQSNSVSL